MFYYLWQKLYMFSSFSVEKKHFVENYSLCYREPGGGFNLVWATARVVLTNFFAMFASVVIHITLAYNH